MTQLKTKVLNNEKVILFGAGRIGQEALNYFGEENVINFCDNAQSKVGKNYIGKTIISFSELEKSHKADIIVICVDWPISEEISAQLEAAGFSSVINYKVLVKHEKLLTNCELSQYKSIALYGNDRDASTLIHMISIIYPSLITSVILQEDSEQVKEVRGVKVRSLKEVANGIEGILIVTQKYHLAIVERLKKYIRENDAEFNIIDPFRIRYFGDEDVLVSNHYNSAHLETEDEWIERTAGNDCYQDSAIAFINEIKDEPPLFKLIEIETLNRCNGVCSFCPVNRNVDPREMHYMSEELFHSIINQLESLHYTGRISLFSNNEPLLDDRIVEFHDYARKHLPDATFHLFTNGTLLTLDIFKKLIGYLDEFAIDNYNQELKIIPQVQKIVEYCTGKIELEKKVTVCMRRPKDILSTRGGNAPNRTEMPTYPEMKCIHPFQQMVVRPTGKVSLCCNDPLGKITLGDLNKQSLLDVWYGEKYQEAREALSKGRKHYGTCQYCDVFFMY
ncbi:SPASM domain-containing protein [Candidatus Clostridium helianthi]|uniref:SPASM domain-containing protein n=1 Tax=Candidatus Clostridium helianthi TaxID=3381660 RepID=A0ABW8S5T8_9CLOT